MSFIDRKMSEDLAKKNLIGRIEERPQWSQQWADILCEQKVIFLNKENLAELEGYKATAKLILLTYLSWEVYNNLLYILKDNREKGWQFASEQKDACRELRPNHLDYTHFSGGYF